MENETQGFSEQQEDVNNDNSTELQETDTSEDGKPDGSSQSEEQDTFDIDGTSYSKEEDRKSVV